MSIDQWRITYRTDKDERRTVLVMATQKVEAWKSAIGYEHRTYSAIAVELVEIRWNGAPNGPEGLQWVVEVSP